MKTKNLLAVSLVAIMAVGVARADIASTKYVTDRTGDTSEIATGLGNNLTAAVNALNTALGDVKSTANDAATKTYVDTELAKKQANLGTNQMAAVNSGITAAKVESYDGLDAKITAAKTQADKGVSDAAAAKTAADAAQATADAAVVANTAITENTTGATKIKYDAKGLVTGSASLDAADIPDLATSKITGLDTALTGKQDKSNMVTSTTDVTTDADSTVKYPSMATTYAIVENSALDVTGKINDEVTARESADTSLQQQITTNKGSIDTITTSLGNKQDKSTAVKFGGTAAVGSATVPVYVAADGTVTAITSYAGKAATAGTADKATADGAGNNIVSTYATKTDLSGKQANLDTNQMAAVNSGITAAKVESYDGLDAKITAAKTQADKGVSDAAAAKTAADAAQATADAAVVANTAITENTTGATKIKYDAKGLVTGSASLDAADIPDLTAAKITDLGALATANPGTCNATATEKCVLTWDGTAFAWEKIGR